MDRYEPEDRQCTLPRPVRRRCDECGRQSVCGEGRQLKATAGHRSTRENHELRPSKVRRIARKPESGCGDSSAPPRNRSSPSRRAEPGRTLLVHGLGRDINCDHVFNMFCLYGNVMAVKILKNGQVLVELHDAEAAKRCVSNLHLLPLDRKNVLKVKYSKHSCIHDQGWMVKLSDGTPAQKRYNTSKLNRFSNKTKIVDNRRIAAPSKILHFFNAPMDISSSKIRRAVINALGCKDAVQSITILPQKQPDAKCSTGLLEIKSVELAAKAIFLLNHMKLDSSKSKFPFLMKLCFSKWSDMRQKAGDSTALIFNTKPRYNPRLFRRHEHGMFTVEFTVSRVTRATDDDGPWTLWDMRDRATEAIDPETGISTDAQYGSSGQSLQNPQMAQPGLPVDV